MAKDVSWRVPKRRLFSTPLPEETRTYKPISHKELADTTIKAIKDAGFTIGMQEYFSAREGMVANARYTIKDVADEDMQLEIGWQNSYDKTLSLKFAIGTRIMICENGCVSGDFGAFSKKHMGDIKIFAPEEMKNAIKEAAKTFSTMKGEKDSMKKIKINDREKAEIVGRVFLDEQIIGSTQLNIIKDEINHPKYDYECKDSLWELYQYITFSMKEIHPRLWMDDHIKVHKFFNGIVNEMCIKKISDGLKVARRIKAVKIIRDELELKEDPAQLTILDEIKERSFKDGKKI